MVAPDQIREAVARAIAESDGCPDGYTDFNEYFVDQYPSYASAAAAAIAAHALALAKAGLAIVPRKPSDAMRVAALAATFDDRVGDRVHCLDVPIIWQAMVAKSEEETDEKRG